MIHLLFQKTALWLFSNSSKRINNHLQSWLFSPGHKQDIPNILRIRLTAPNQYRVEVLSKELNITSEEAVDFIKNIDEKRKKWSRFLYEVDWENPQLFDLTINIEQIDIEIAAEIISTIIKSPKYQNNELGTTKIKDIYLASKADYLLRFNPRTRGSDFEIKADALKGELSVFGHCPAIGANLWEKDIKEVLSQMEEVKTINVLKSIEGLFA